METSRREFLGDVGKSMLIAGLGAGAADQIGVKAAFAEAGPDKLDFGKLEPLVCLMQETPADKLLPILVDRLSHGAELKEFTAAAVLANARTFGGEDYIGFHTMMALGPAYRISREMPASHRALPVLKVIYRNTARIQQFGGRAREVLKPVTPAAAAPDAKSSGQAMLEAVHRKDVKSAEETLAAVAERSPEDALNDVMFMVQDGQEVHRVVMPYRAWDLLDIVGRKHAHTMLRQSVRYCVKAESPKYSGYFAAARTAIPKLMEQHKLPTPPAVGREADDAWVESLSETIFKSKPEDAAGAVAEALAAGFSAAAIGEAISLAANQLVLRDGGRNYAQPGKPQGSVHGDSTGVHGCDSANAWRNMAGLGNARNRAASLLLGAWQVAKDRGEGGHNLAERKPFPHPDHLEMIKANDADGLLAAVEEAIRGNDQIKAAAGAAKLAGLPGCFTKLRDLLRRYSISEDGALHAEKYYRTVIEELGAVRGKFRIRQVTALARVVASSHGRPAPGYADACRLLGVS